METLASRCKDTLDTNFCRKRRSIRTKFKLSEEAVEVKEWLADFWSMSQKDVSAEVVDIVKRFIESEDSQLREQFVQDAYDQPGSPSRKTHVVTEETRDVLEATADELNLTRDQFFDASLRLTRAMIRESRRSEQIKRHKEILPVIKDLLSHAEAAYSESKEIISDDDPVSLPLFGIMRHLEEMEWQLSEEIKSGKAIDQDHGFI